jgi:proton glutamate symport protein
MSTKVTTPRSGRRPARRRPGLTSWIVIGVAAGVACGLFFGEPMGALGIVGDVFIGLLQMTVLPYIAVALVAYLGRLDPRAAGRLARSAGIVLLALWVLGLAVVVVMPLSWPALKVASFFSTSLIETPRHVDLLGLYVPANPFHAFANNLVPAVVVFCICVGIALMGMRGKQGLIDQLNVLAGAMLRVASFFVRLTPVGVFAIAASAAGTMSLREFGRLQAYVLSFALAGVVLTFWVLPALVTACTPFRYRDVLSAGKEALVTAFAVGSTFVVLPLLIEHASRLVRERGLEGDDAVSGPAVLVPLAYPFPTVGKLLALLFVPFAAWFVGSAMSLAQFPAFLGAGLLASFASGPVSIPFLLDMLRLPQDMFELFLLSGVLTARIGDMAGTMHLLVLTLLTVALLQRRFRVDLRRLAFAAAVSGALLLAAVAGSRAGLDRLLTGRYQKSEVLLRMQLIESPVPAVIVAEAAPNPVPLKPGQTRIDRMRQRGVLRVGYDPQSLPFAYRNGGGDLVGFDIDMAHRLARDLGVTLEFVPFAPETLARQLGEDDFDVAMSGVAETLGRAERMQLSDPYLDLHAALVVPDYLRQEFSTVEAIRERSPVRIGAVARGYFAETLRDLPSVELVELASPADFFESRAHVDAFACSAEAGSAWTLRYPQYTVVTPVHWALPLVYPVGGGPDEPLLQVVDRWIELKRLDGTIDKLYDYWILGQQAESRGPRWSIVRDVLHWVE